VVGAGWRWGGEAGDDFGQGCKGTCGMWVRGV
jgi:hypothetical protein